MSNINSETVLKVKNLKVMFASDRGMIRSVEGVDLEVHKGECVALVGESGCGKSVTSLTIMGLRNEPPCIWKADQLDLNINGQMVSLMGKTEKELQDIRGKYISMVFQDPMTCLNPVMTCGAQIDEVFLRHQKDDMQQEINAVKEQKQALQAKAKQLKEEGKADEAAQVAKEAKSIRVPKLKDVARQRSISALKAVNVPSPEKRYKDYPHQLSGGKRQRVMIAMAYACRPSFMIADEPTTALDVTIQAQVLELMNGLRRCNDTGLLLITHDLSVVANMAEEIYVMYSGKIVEKATTDELFDNPLHPYTRGLIGSIPKLAGKHGDRFVQIPDNVPHPTMKPKGCYFNPRCAYATDKCREVMPPLETLESGRQVRCWNYKVLQEEDQKKKKGGN